MLLSRCLTAAGTFWCPRVSQLFSVLPVTRFNRRFRQSLPEIPGRPVAQPFIMALLLYVYNRTMVHTCWVSKNAPVSSVSPLCRVLISTTGHSLLSTSARYAFSFCVSRFPIASTQVDQVRSRIMYALKYATFYIAPSFSLTLEWRFQKSMVIVLHRRRRRWRSISSAVRSLYFTVTGGKQTFCTSHTKSETTLASHLQACSCLRREPSGGLGAQTPGEAHLEQSNCNNGMNAGRPLSVIRRGNFISVGVSGHRPPFPGSNGYFARCGILFWRGAGWCYSSVGTAPHRAVRPWPKKRRTATHRRVVENEFRMTPRGTIQKHYICIQPHRSTLTQIRTEKRTEHLRACEIKKYAKGWAYVEVLFSSVINPSHRIHISKPPRSTPLKKPSLQNPRRSAPCNYQNSKSPPHRTEPHPSILHVKQTHPGSVQRCETYLLQRNSHS